MTYKGPFISPWVKLAGLILLAFGKQNIAAYVLASGCVLECCRLGIDGTEWKL